MPFPIARACLPLVLLASAVAPAAAAIGGGDDIHDLRLAIGIAPGYDFSGPNDVGSSPRLGIEYFANVLNEAPFGTRYVAGGEFSVNPASSHGIDVMTSAFTGFFGLSRSLESNERVHFEGTPFVGIGVTQVDTGGATDNKTYFEFGVRAAGFYTFENRFQVGVDIRFLSGQSVDNKWDNRGLVFGVVGGYRF